MTTGEGGMLTTNNIAVAEKARKLINHGSEKKYEHDFLGYNYRMTEIAAVIGLEQLKKLEGFNKKRRENARYLNQRLSGIKGLITPEIVEDQVFHQYTVRITPELGKRREEVIKFLSEKGVETGIFYPRPIHKQEAYSEYKEQSFPIAEKLAQEVLSLPVHPGLSEEEIGFIVKAFEELKDS